MTRKIVSFLLGYLCYCQLLLSQSVEILNLQLTDNEEVVLTFRIQQDNSLKERYNIKIYSSHDGYANALDVERVDIKPATTVEVRFSGPEKIGAFAGDLRLRVVAEASVFPIKVLSSSPRAVKRKKTYTVSWDDYHRQGPYDVELLRGSDVVHKIVTSTSATSYSYSLPKTLDKGAYTLQVTPVGNRAAQSEGYPMKVKGSSAGLLAGAGVAAGGGLVYLLLLSGGDSSMPPTTDDDLPDPPGTPQ